jgi:hypothetical protein
MNAQDTTDLGVRTVTLHVERFIAAHLVDWPFANDPRITVDHVAEYAGAMLMQMIQDVLIQRELLAEYPSTWWDAFKLRWFPKWALKRWPVVMNRIDGEILYPKIAIPHREGFRMRLAVYPVYPDTPLREYTNHSPS